MSAVTTLTKRNLRLFLREKRAVFLSFLSALIVIALYFLFLAKVYKNGMNGTVDGDAISIADGAKSFIVYLQMMAGVTILNSMSLAVGAFSVISKDFENKHIDCLLLTPVRIHETIVSYFATGFIASFAINVFAWGLSIAVIGIGTGYWLSAGSFAYSLFVLFVSSLVSCSFMLLVTVLIKSSSALGVVNGVSGTFFGFLCGIYIPFDSLGEATKAVGSVLPFSHLTIWLKRVALDDAFGQVGISGEVKNILYRNYFSAENIGFLSHPAPLRLMVFLSVMLGLLCLAVSCILLNRRIKGQRNK